MATRSIKMELSDDLLHRRVEVWASVLDLEYRRKGDRAVISGEDCPLLLSLLGIKNYSTDTQPFEEACASWFA